MIASGKNCAENRTNGTTVEESIGNVPNNFSVQVDIRDEPEKPNGSVTKMSIETTEKDSVGDNGFIESSSGLSSGENVIQFCEQVVAIATSDNEDMEEDARAVAGNEEYVFPTPEEMEKDTVPAVGMEFPTLEDATRFVNVYAQKNGFAMIKGRNYKQRKISFQCNKCRKREDSFSGTRKRKRNIVEGTNCQMNVTVKLEDAKWHVVSLFLEHNHGLVSSPSLARFFLSHRHMNEAEIMLSKLLQEHRVKPRLIMSIFRKLRGGKYGNITFDVKNLDNLKQDERLKKKKNTDIEWTLRYVEKLQVESPGFCYKM